MKDGDSERIPFYQFPFPLAISTSSDPIFGRPQKKSGWLWWLIFFIALGYGWHLLSRPKPVERIETNQKAALETIQKLLKVYSRWQRNDYDGNGRRDIPLGPFRQLKETELVNGHSLDLIKEDLAMADLREKQPKALKGYYFTATHPDLEWPSEEMVSELVILAKPAKPGVSGSCSFYVSTSGEAWYTSIALEQKVPPWPDRRAIDAGIWILLPFEELNP